MHTRRQLLILSLALIFLGAVLGCAENPESAPRYPSSMAVDTLDGVIVVNNTGPGYWEHGAGWRITTDWRIGAVQEADQEFLFGGVTNLAIGPEFEIAVIDFQAQHVRVFDRNGSFLRVIGRPGGGPGEFDGPLASAWDSSNRLWVVDGWNQRYSVFDSTGSLVYATPRRTDVARFTQDLAFDQMGMLIDESGSRRAVNLVRVDSAGDVIDTLAPIVRPSLVPDNVEVPSFALRGLGAFMPELRWTVTPDGFVWFTRTDELRLIQRTFAGDTLRIVNANHREYALTSEEERAIEQQLRRSGLNRSDFAFGRQFAQSVNVLHDGHLLVLIEQIPGQGGALFDVFDPSGRYLGSVHSEFMIDSRVTPRFRGDTMVAVVRDEMDVQYLVRATIER